MADARAAVEWRDLVAMRRGETVAELLLPLPWLAGSLVAAGHGLYPFALALSFVFFLTGLRLNHGGCHHAIGLGRRATDAVLLVLSVLMLGSMHAVRWNHLRHHRHCLADEDIEAMGARRSGLGAILLGPWFPLRLHATAWQGGGHTVRRWIAVELAANLLWLPLLVGPFALDVTRYHVAAMLLGQSLTAFFAVWTVHHDCPPGIVARTIRNRLKSLMTFDMFYHREHHLFPAVPTPHLPALARRLDAAEPVLPRLLVW
jgi:fatty acid desaturase